MLDGYFDNLAAAATTEKALLAKLVESNAMLTTSNAQLSATVAKLNGKNRTLQKELNTLRRRSETPPVRGDTVPGGAGGAAEPRRGMRRCLHYKRDNYNKPENCHELEQNKDRRPPGWRSFL